ncbi:hypothetical protein [Geothrix terrae]|uniref:hypothetical protein n=1 Tax=Geothrix terrae TaxID=2922720 RepID=UPI001FAD7990|nr:hypothetical protein [Geothrix terrae]
MYLSTAIIFLVCLGIRVGLHFFDKNSIQEAAKDKGWVNVQVIWTPFASGWFLLRNDKRQYRVIYSREDGVMHEARCKSSIQDGVQWCDTAHDYD